MFWKTILPFAWVPPSWIYTLSNHAIPEQARREVLLLGRGRSANVIHDTTLICQQHCH